MKLKKLANTLPSWVQRSSNFELQKFKVFCLVQAKENRKALAQLELMKEAGFKDSFFVQKVNYLQGMLLSKKGGRKYR